MVHDRSTIISLVYFDDQVPLQTISDCLEAPRYISILFLAFGKHFPFLGSIKLTHLKVAHLKVTHLKLTHLKVTYKSIYMSWSEMIVEQFCSSF